MMHQVLYNVHVTLFVGQLHTIIEYGSTLYIGIHKVFQLLTYNSKMRRTMKLKST